MNDDDEFRRRMGDVKPLSGPARVPHRPASSPRVRLPEPPRFHLDGDSGRAEGVNDRQMARLQGGRHKPEHKIDLHGLSADSATDRVRREIARAADEGLACVLIIHGRGRRSPGPPVLREVVIQALTTAPTARRVRAFCPALPEHGGAGAMYVLLKRRGRRSPPG